MISLVGTWDILSFTQSVINKSEIFFYKSKNPTSIILEVLQGYTVSFCQKTEGKIPWVEEFESKKSIIRLCFWHWNSTYPFRKWLILFIAWKDVTFWYKIDGYTKNVYHQIFSFLEGGFIFSFQCDNYWYRNFLSPNQ